MEALGKGVSTVATTDDGSPAGQCGKANRTTLPGIDPNAFGQIVDPGSADREGVTYAPST